MRNAAFVVIMLLGVVLSAQPIQFSRTYPIGTGSDYTAGVTQKPDSGFVFVSNLWQPGIVGFAFTSTDKYGDTLFTRSYAFTTLGFSLGGPHSMIIASDGNYVQCGTSTDSAQNEKGCVIKFDTNGDTMWMKNYDSPVFDRFCSVYEDENGMLWLVGSTKNTANGQDNFWLVVADANGVVQTDTTYGTPQIDIAMCGGFTYDGGFIMSGERGGVPYIVKIDSTFAVEWSRTFNGYYRYGFIMQLPDTNFVLATTVQIGNDYHAVILKLDSFGNIASADTLIHQGWTTLLYTQPIAVQDGIVVAGVTMPTNGAAQGLWLKTDFDGNLMWQRDYVIVSFTSQYIYDIQPTSDHGFVMAGSFSDSQQDSWLVKTDSLGCPVPACDGVPVQDEHNAYDILFFPNPSNGVLNVSGILPAGSELMIFNQLGQLVVPPVQLSTSGSTNITTDLAGGIYFCRIVANGELIKDETIAITE